MDEIYVGTFIAEIERDLYGDQQVKNYGFHVENAPLMFYGASRFSPVFGMTRRAIVASIARFYIESGKYDRTYCDYSGRMLVIRAREENLPDIVVEVDCGEKEAFSIAENSILENRALYIYNRLV